MTATAAAGSVKPDAAAVVTAARLSTAARTLIGGERSAAECFHILVNQGYLKDAVSFLAHWLPPRQAVWWSCECAWHACRPEPDQVAAEALRAAVAWVVEPSEEHRLAAQTAGRRASVRTPAGCTALAAGWSGGSMSPYAKSPVAPPPSLAARTVVSAIELIAVASPPAKVSQRYLQLLRIGTEVAYGGNRWSPATGDP